MNKFIFRLFGICIASVGGLFVYISVKDVVSSNMDIFPVNFIIGLIGVAFIVFGIAFILGKAIKIEDENQTSGHVEKTQPKVMSKQSTITLILAIVLTAIMWFSISDHYEECETNFGINSTAASRPNYSSCACDTGYWLSEVTRTCVTPLTICQENNIQAVSASEELRSNYDDYIQCKTSDNATKEIERGSVYPYKFK